MQHKALYWWHNACEYLSGDVAVAQLCEVKALQVGVTHALFSHPTDQIVHPPSCCGSAGELKIHEAVLTRPGDAHIRRGARLAVRSLPHDDRTGHGITLRGTGEGSGDGFLAGDIDVLPLTRYDALCMRQHGASCASRGAVHVKMRKPHTHWRAVRIPRHIHEAP